MSKRAGRCRFDRGLADTISWYDEHRDWWQPLLPRRAVDEFQPR